MKKSSCAKRTHRIRIAKMLCAPFFILFSLTVNAQTTTTFPPLSSCTSGDLSLVSAALTGGDPCNSCSPGQTLTRNLTLGINNKTGSTRTAFAFWGTLEITHADGTVTTSTINRCTGPVAPTGPLPAAYTGGNFGTITYQCGDALRLTNLYLAWTDASPNSTCASLKSSTINPKCGTLPSIRINAGVNGSFVSTAATCTDGGSLAVSPFGGTAPYTVVANGITRTAIPANGTTTFTDLAGGSYPVVITDALGCTITLTRTVNAPTPLAAPDAAAVQPTCAVATGTVNITSPQAGITYTLRQNGNVIHTAVAGVCANVQPGTYLVHASNGSCNTPGSNVTVNQQPGTPATPAATVVQPSCTVATATVNVTSPVAGVTYTLKQSGSVVYTAVAGVFSSVATGTYLLNASNGTCNADGNNVVVNQQPPTPAEPEVCIVQPSLCGPATGSVTILSPVGAGYEYSITNGNTWQASPSFADVAAGTVTGIMARKDGCVSAAANCDDSSCETARMTVTNQRREIEEKTEPAGFDAFPVPFKDGLTIKYQFDYTSNVTIEVFDYMGMLILSKTDHQGTRGREFVLSFPVERERLYFIRLTTSRGSTTKTVISSK